MVKTKLYQKLPPKKKTTIADSDKRLRKQVNNVERSLKRMNPDPNWEVR